MEERIHHQRQQPRGAADPALSFSGDDESTDGEFEFPCFLGADKGSPALADDLFADGRIRPATFYPVFGRRSSVDADGSHAPAPAPPTERRKRGQLGRLFLEESRAWNSSSSSSSSGSSASTSSSRSTATKDHDGGGLEGAAPESYCVWVPGGASSAASTPRPRKGGSTGSMARWRRISDLVVGRSHSDGKEKFLFLPANPPPPPIKHETKNLRAAKMNTAAGGAKKKAAAPGTEIGTVAAARRAAQYGAAKAVGAGTTPRRTFLPYREELVGFFANVHGISRSHPHPY